MNFTNSQFLKHSIFLYKKYLNQFTYFAVFNKHYSIKGVSLQFSNSNLDDELIPVEDLLYKIDDYNNVTKGDSNKLQLVKLYQLNFELAVQLGEKIPTHLTQNSWRKLISMNSPKHREKYLYNLWQEEKVEMFKKKYELEYRNSLENRTLWSFVNYKRRREIYHNKLLQSMMFGSKLIIDMGYEKYMTERECHFTAVEIFNMWYENRSSLNPFFLIFCNVKPENSVLMNLGKLLPEIHNNTFPATFTEKSYLDLYPKEKIVYLTPHCTEEVDEYDHDSVYVIGATVDINKRKPLSYERAIKDGVRTARFPLDRYMNIVIRKRILTFRQSLAIMNDIKNATDWKYAFRHYVKLTPHYLNMETSL